MARRSNDSGEQLFRHLAAMKPFSLFERSSDPREEPSVMVWAKCKRGILGTGNPGIVWQTPVGISSVVSVDQLTSRLDSYLRIELVEGEVLFVFYKMKKMRM